MEKDARVIHNPTNIGELVLIEELMLFLYTGNVFIHHKKPLSKELINKLSNDSIRKVEILHYNSSDSFFEKIEEILNSRENVVSDNSLS